MGAAASDFISDTELLNAMLANEDYLTFCGLVTAAVSDYATLRKLSNGAKAAADGDSNYVDIDFDTRDEDGSKYLDATIKAGYRIDISKKDNTYADVRISATQTLGIGTAAALDIGLWYYDIDFKAKLYSKTTFKLDIILTNKGKTVDISKEIDSLINDFDDDSLVAMYRSNIDMPTNELTIISANITRIAIRIKIIEIGIPVDFRVSLDVNSSISAKLTVTVVRRFGICGNDEDGLSSYSDDISRKIDLEMSSLGQIGTEAGISVGIELSFTGLSCVGRVGIEAEFGVFFEYYGYGKHGNSAGYYEAGIYVEFNIYARSDLFGLDATAGIYEHKWPFLKGGSQMVALGFEKSDPIEATLESMNIKDMGYLKLKFLNLKTGEVSYRDADLDSYSMISSSHNANSYFLYDGNGNIAVPEQQAPKFDPYQDAYTEITIKYNGPNGDLSNQYLFTTIVYNYKAKVLEEGEVVDREYSVGFWYDSETPLYSTLVKWGETISDEQFAEAEKALREYDTALVGFKWSFSDVKEFDPDRLIKKPTTIFAWNREYVTSSVTFTYLVDIGIAAWQKETLRADVGTDPETLVKKLSAFGHIDENYYRFVKWDKTFEPTPPSAAYGGRDVTYVAEYEKIPFYVTVEIAPVKNHAETVIQAKRYAAVEVLWGEPIFINAYTESISHLYGYDFVLTDDEGNVIETALTFTSPETIKGCYRIKTGLTVTVLDDKENVLAKRTGITFGEDVSDILDETAVLAFIEEYNAGEPSFTGHSQITRKFKAWMNGTKLTSVPDYDVTVYPLLSVDISSLYTLIKLDAQEGKFARAYEWQAENGIQMTYGTQESVSDWTMFNPTKAKSGEKEYSFRGWFETPSCEGEPVENIVADVRGGTKTYYAGYSEIDRLFSFSALANGEAYVAGEGGTYDKTDVDGAFGDNSEEYARDNLTKTELDALIATFKGGSAEIGNPSADGYTFAYWLTSDFDGNVVLKPFYRLNDAEVVLTFDFGKGSAPGYPGEHIYISTISIHEGETVEIDLKDWLLPALTNERSVSIVDENGDLIEEFFFYCYLEDNYYYKYVQPICWSVDGVNPLSEEDAKLILSDDDEIKSHSFIALYEAVARPTVLINFSISDDLYNNGAGYDLGSLTPDRWVHYERPYGTELTDTMIPTVVAPAYNEDVNYEYYHSGWYINELDRDISLDALDDYNAFTEDLTFYPKFAVRRRTVTITLDATENGYFASTGGRYRETTAFAGEPVFLGEAPIWCGDTEYYNYNFDIWNDIEPSPLNYDVSGEITEPKAFVNDATVWAIYSRLRNGNPAPMTGVYISDGVTTEDIAYGKIHGYTYYPELRELKVLSPGLTISGETNDLSILVSVDITFGDLKLTRGNPNEGYDGMAFVYFMPAADGITVSIAGKVELIDEAKTSSATLLCCDDPVNVRLVGMTDDAELLISQDSSGGDITDAVLLTHLGNLTISGLDVTVTAKLNGACTFDAVAIADGELILTDAVLSVSVENALEDKTYAIVLYNNGEISQQTLDAVIVSGCDKLNPK